MSGEDKKPKRRRKCIHAFFYKLERDARVRNQRDMFRLCDENRKLGGTYYLKVLKRFRMKESDLWHD